MARRLLVRTAAKDTKVKMRPKNINPILIECALSDIFGAKMKICDVAAKYNVHRTTINKWIAKNKHLKSKYEVFEPEPILLRKDKPELERLELLNSDSMSVMELSLALVRKRLEDELNVSPDVKIASTDKIKMNELSVIIAQVAPFVLPKKESGKGAKETRQKPMGLARNMFKEAK